MQEKVVVAARGREDRGGVEIGTQSLFSRPTTRNTFGKHMSLLLVSIRCARSEKNNLVSPYRVTLTSLTGCLAESILSAGETSVASCSEGFERVTHFCRMTVSRREVRMVLIIDLQDRKKGVML